MVEKIQGYQQALDGRSVPVGCAWCEPKLPEDTSHKFCPTHRDQFFLEALTIQMKGCEMDQTRGELVLQTVRGYLDRIRDKVVETKPEPSKWVIAQKWD